MAVVYTLNVDKERIDVIELGDIENLEQCEYDLDESYHFWSWDVSDIEIELMFVKQLSFSKINGFLL